MDYHPFSSGWRVSAGTRYVDIELQGVAKSGMSFGGVSYSANEIGNVTATIRNGNTVAPYLGFGYNLSHFSTDGAGFKLGVDIGAMYIGEPDVTIKTAITPTNPKLFSGRLVGSLFHQRQPTKLSLLPGRHAFCAFQLLMNAGEKVWALGYSGSARSIRPCGRRPLRARRPLRTPLRPRRGRGTHSRCRAAPRAGPRARLR